MTYLVCQNNDDGRMFITTRQARETMISVITGLGQVVDSRVLRKFQTYDEADKFLKRYNKK